MRSNPPKDPTGSPLQPSLMMQSGVVNDRVVAGKDSRVQRLLVTSLNDDAKVMAELFPGTISRWPTSAEQAVAKDGMKAHRTHG